MARIYVSYYLYCSTVALNKKKTMTQVECYCLQHVLTVAVL